MQNAVEATILSSEGSNGLFNSLAGSGKLPSESGSALPFSSVLRNQQQIAEGSVPTVISEEGMPKSNIGLGSALQTTPTFQQLSLSAHAETAAAASIVVQANDNAGASASMSMLLADSAALTSEDELGPTVTWVDPAQLNSSIQDVIPTDESAAALTVVRAESKLTEPLPLSDTAQLFDRSGGGGSPERTAMQTLPQTPTIETKSSAENASVNAGADDQLIATEKMLQTQQAQSSNQSNLENPRAVPREMGERSLEQNIQYASQTGVAKQSSGDGPTGQSPAVLSDKVNLPELSESAETFGDRPTHGPASTVEMTQLDRDRESANSINTAPGTENPNRESAEVAVRSGSLNTGMETSAETKQSDSEGVTDRRAQLDAQSDRIADSRKLKQQEADLEAVKMATYAATSASSNTVASSVSVNENAASQVRPAVNSQSKKSSTDSIESAVATDGSEGYHWLNGGDASNPESNAELQPTNRVMDGGSAQSTPAVAITAVSTNGNNNAASVESFASVKQSAEAVQSNAVQSAEQADAAASFEIDTPVRDAQWSQALAYRVQFMAQQGIQRAQVQLNPADLGPMEITVDVADDVAQVKITAENATTLEAVEQAVPRLREMLAQSGFADTGVDLNGESEDSQSASAESPLNKGQTDAKGEGTGSGGSQTPVDSSELAHNTVSGNTTPERRPDGSLSFYV